MDRSVILLIDIILVAQLPDHCFSVGPVVNKDELFPYTHIDIERVATPCKFISSLQR